MCFMCFLSGRLMMKMRCCMEKQKSHYLNHPPSQNQVRVLWHQWLLRRHGELFGSTFNPLTFSAISNLGCFLLCELCFSNLYLCCMIMNYCCVPSFTMYNHIIHVNSTTSFGFLQNHHCVSLYIYIEPSRD